ncbi:hypothetical protein CLU85_3133 [Acidovorax sp. 69]|uniref:type IV pilus assembly protein FimV n=1 Tax=Acidovorax sp. 69 TaxID=2035202 RepID=UPI000CB59C91|nr:hypothetical protein [Acidovorax sp. 69]PJI98313.1 hypothetical protein CLU85_3133 [Acidovorax sp. 69]
MIRNSLIVVCMGLAAPGAGALSLGAPQGTVWLGKPIDLGFEVQLDPGMSMDAICPQARLVSGDLSVPAGRVQVSVQPGELGRNPVVRVQSSHLADEPVLTAQVSISCIGSFMREYTFLADLPMSVAGGNRPIAIPWEGQASGATSSWALPGAAAEKSFPGETVAPPPRKASASERVARKAMKSSSKPLARSPSDAAVAAVPSSSGAQPEASILAPKVAVKVEAKKASPAAETSRPAVAPDPASAAAAPARPRLVMEPLATLATPSTSGDQASSGAPGSGEALPSIGVGNSQDAGGAEGERLQALQTEIERMREQAEQDRQATLAMLTRLEKMDTGYFPASLVYGLLAVLALTMIAAVLGVMRMRRALSTSNEEWRNTLNAFAAQSSLPRQDGAEPARQEASSPNLGRMVGAAVLPV